VKALKDDMPEGMLFGRKAKVCHLRAFGCVAYTQVPKKLCKKLEPNSKKLILIGYLKHVKGYHIWNPSNDKIMMSRDVVFNEVKVGNNSKPSHMLLLESNKVSNDVKDNDDVEFETDHIMDK